MSSKLLRKISARARGAVDFHEAKALWAASTAARHSSGDALETCASIEPSTGLVTSIFFECFCHLPLIRESIG